MKKLLSLVLAAGMLTAALAGCGSKAANDSISVLTREEGSGTRGAFIELFGIEQKDANGKRLITPSQARKAQIPPRL